MPTKTLHVTSDLDVFCIPGGPGIDALLEDREVLSFVRRQASRSCFVTSVCTGALLLGAAGLLKGRRATTHYLMMDDLRSFGAIPSRSRFVRDGNLVTAGGVTAGIDFALWILGELLTRTDAEAVQLGLEYAPEPPYTSGSESSASPGGGGESSNGNSRRLAK